MIGVLTSQRDRDHESVRFAYPYFVIKKSRHRLDLEILDWLTATIGEDYMVVDTYSHGPKTYAPPWVTRYVNVTPWVTTYAFKDEADAITYKLKFP